jgi:hypothetical protein
MAPPAVRRFRLIGSGLRFGPLGPAFRSNSDLIHSIPGPQEISSSTTANASTSQTDPGQTVIFCITPRIGHVPSAPRPACCASAFEGAAVIADPPRSAPHVRAHLDGAKGFTARDFFQLTGYSRRSRIPNLRGLTLSRHDRGMRAPELRDLRQFFTADRAILRSLAKNEA